MPKASNIKYIWTFSPHHGRPSIIAEPTISCLWKSGMPKRHQDIALKQDIFVLGEMLVLMQICNQCFFTKAY